MIAAIVASVGNRHASAQLIPQQPAGPAATRSLIVPVAPAPVRPGAAAPGPPRPAGLPASLSPAPGSGPDVWRLPNPTDVNEGTVTIITAPAGGATSVFGSDMARVLDDQSNIRVLPVLGKGPVRNVSDILFLKSIDMGAVAADVPEFYRLQYGIPDITSQLRYIARLYHSEIHIIARSSIRSIFDLNGKRIIAPTDVGFYSARVIFNRLNLTATFDYATDDAKSIQKLVDGEADAYIVSTGKVFQLARAIRNDNRALHLVTIPYDRRLQNLYLPTTLSSDDYPNLLNPGETIETVAIGMLLVSYNWPENTERYRKVARFVDAFFANYDEFMKPPRHPKWTESSIVAAIPGWKRFKAAEDWLVARNMVPRREVADVQQAQFESFVRQSGGQLSNDPAERSALFRQFLQWRQQHGGPPTPTR
ncbi:TAXI family TRAP transporter solute-binding subunit [Bradyrhizobium oligotrophicum]